MYTYSYLWRYIDTCIHLSVVVSNSASVNVFKKNFYLTASGPICSTQGDLSLWCWGFSLDVPQAPEQVDSVVVACGLSCPTACGILGP